MLNPQQGQPQYDNRMWQGQPPPPPHYPPPRQSSQPKKTTMRGKAKKVAKTAFFKSFKVSRIGVFISLAFIASCFLCFFIYKYKKQVKKPVIRETKELLYKGRKQKQTKF